MKRQLPDDWTPSDSHREKCLRLSVSCEDEVEAFRDHHLANGNRMMDWDRAFHNWLRNAVRFGKTNGKAPPPERVRTLSPGERWE